MQYWLVDSLFIFNHLPFSLSLLLGKFSVRKVHPSGDGSARYIHLVCGSLGVYQFYWCLTSSFHLAYGPVHYFAFLAILFSSAFVTYISDTEHFYFLFFGTRSAGSTKVHATSKLSLMPIGASPILIEINAAWTSDSSQSTLCKIHFILCLVSGNWCSTCSAQRWSMVYDEKWWLRKACSENPVLPVHFLFTSNFIGSLISWYQW